MKVVFLSCGAVAAEVARRVAAGGGFDEMVVADLNEQLANDVAASIDFPNVRAARFDAADSASIASMLEGADIVFNGVGPYYRFGQAVVREAINAGAHYVDICDEYDTTETLLQATELDQQARDKGLTILTSMGSAPGLTNLTARWAADQLDTAKTITIAMAVPFALNLGVTINDHMLHCFEGDITQFIDGEYQKVKGWGDPRRYRLLPPFDQTDHEFGYFGHAESVSLPHFIPGLSEVTTRFTWLQAEGNKIYQDFARMGLTSTDPEGLDESPRRFLARFMATPGAKEALRISYGGQPPGSVWHIEATGELDGAPTTVVAEGHLMYNRASMVDGPSVTAIPASLAVRELIDGRITARGVLAPEAAIDPEPFLRAAYGQLGVTLYTSITRTEQLI